MAPSDPTIGAYNKFIEARSIGPRHWLYVLQGNLGSAVMVIRRLLRSSYFSLVNRVASNLTSLLRA